MSSLPGPSDNLGGWGKWMPTSPTFHNHIPTHWCHIGLEVRPQLDYMNWEKVERQSPHYPDLASPYCASLILSGYGSSVPHWHKSCIKLLLSVLLLPDGCGCSSTRPCWHQEEGRVLTTSNSHSRYSVSFTPHGGGSTAPQSDPMTPGWGWSRWNTSPALPCLLNLSLLIGEDEGWDWCCYSVRKIKRHLFSLGEERIRSHSASLILPQQGNQIFCFHRGMGKKTGFQFRPLDTIQWGKQFLVCPIDTNMKENESPKLPSMGCNGKLAPPSAPLKLWEWGQVSVGVSLK